MVSTIHPKHRPSLTRAAEALQARPPRVRSALKELRKVFTDSGENPPAILAACATLLNTDAALSGDVLAAVRTAHAEWDSYGETERELFHQCVWSSQTRRAVAVTEVNDVTAMLREQPKRIADALNGLRWLNAATGGTQQHAFTTCATLLKNPSATHPAIVEAIHTAHQLWPILAEDMRTLVMTCVYASKARAAHARARTAARQQAAEAESGDIRRCGNCDGNLAGLPELRYCSDACRKEAEAAERPAEGEHTTTVPAHRIAARHEPIEQRAARRYVDSAAEPDYDEQWREVEQAIPSAGLVRKNESTVDAYEGERRRHGDIDDTSEILGELSGKPMTDEDYYALALLPVTPGGLCVACNLERTPSEQRAHSTDDRCEMCRDRDMPPLCTFAPSRELAAVA
ncbi:hypothetical protein H4696_000285 [Amycolatopsis lexingtonensis]|uniref:DUF222 domain-containing protein n=1 Tax=Amycolatopsis lexingtonensis TaxID=218822 RepID=A0ABR9HQJ5_9PSEU|nr:hypothetical protein [Amycolatopsis lexingtonensis]MBE1493185.1 hypothetical protein [Amycolatopsis lexingtonensis]